MIIMVSVVVLVILTDKKFIIEITCWLCIYIYNKYFLSITHTHQISFAAILRNREC